MKIVISPENIRIDKIVLSVKSFVNFKGGHSFFDLQKINNTKFADGRITVKRADLECYFYQGQNNKTFLQHDLRTNGIKLFRPWIKMSPEEAALRATCGKFNFLPLSLSHIPTEQFIFKHLPLMIGETLERITESMASNIGILARNVAPGLITVQPQKQYFLLFVEGGVDVPVPAFPNILDNYNFMENLARLGTLGLNKIGDEDSEHEFDERDSGFRWHADKTHNDNSDGERNCLQLVGRLHNGKATFSIYIKDKNNPDTHQLRVEVKNYPGKKSVIRTKFSIYGKKPPFLIDVFNQLIHGIALPFANDLLDLDYPHIPIGDRNDLIRAKLRELRKENGWPVDSSVASEIYEELIHNYLLLWTQLFSPSTQKIVRCNPSMFHRVVGARGLYYFNRKALWEK